jgi:hypothetical protein
VTGDIQANFLTADVSAATLKGSITISTTGGGQATTLKGGISASIGTVRWTGTHVFETGDGDLDLTIPSDANVMVRASAFRGAITSDFPLEAMGPAAGNFAMESGTLGSGGRSLNLSTFNGNITLRQGPPSAGK